MGQTAFRGLNIKYRVHYTYALHTDNCNQAIALRVTKIKKTERRSEFASVKTNGKNTHIKLFDVFRNFRRHRVLSYSKADNAGAGCRSEGFANDVYDNIVSYCYAHVTWTERFFAVRVYLSPRHITTPPSRVKITNYDDTYLCKGSHADS